MNKKGRVFLLTGFLLSALLQQTIAQRLQQIRPFGARLIPKKGLLLHVQDVAITAGSEINFFTPDRKQHDYYFTWWEQDADSSLPGRDILYIGSNNTAIGGLFSLTQIENSAYVDIDCKRNDRKTGRADVVYTKIWLPYFTQATWKDSRGFIALENLETFYDTVLYVYSSLGNFRFGNDRPFRLKKEENPHPKATDFARRAQYLLLYENDIVITQDNALQRKFSVTYQSDTAKRETRLSETLPGQMPQLHFNPTSDKAWTPPAPATPLLLPRPLQATFKEGFYELPFSFENADPSLLSANVNKPSPSSSSGQAPTLVDSSLRFYQELLRYQWQLPGVASPGMWMHRDTALLAEHYRLQVNEKGIRIDFADRAGWQHALYSLAQLTQTQNGKLVIGHCQIEDGPALSFRGIHMFTGPASWPLHKRMYDRVLLPLKMNKTVLQCEQAAWKSFPAVHNSISVPLQDLQTEFAYLRKNQVEPIPLIQSLGHMEWFFKPISTRHWAVNPQYPYTLDPRKKGAQQAILSIWNEAFALLQPRTIHVGFDEIGMIGFNLDREKEVSFFKTQIELLHRYATQKKASLMIWGDMGLAPGEGPDACNGITPPRASAIRKSIPKGTWVADWHYLGNPDPEVYRGSLQLWKKEGVKPLASPWLLANNVRGFTLAAIEEQAGLLQTTWADFESSEKNMLLNIEQFGAYVLALDYAWSGRKELPEALPYDPIRFWTQRFYGQSLPLKEKMGKVFDQTLALQNSSSAIGQNRPAVATFVLDQPFLASGLHLAAFTETILPEAAPVVIVTGFTQDRPVFETTLRYGAEVRSLQDDRPCYAAVAGKEEKDWYLFFERSLSIDKITVRSLNSAAGFTVKRFTIIE